MGEKHQNVRKFILIFSAGCGIMDLLTMKEEKTKYILAWADIHRDELNALWEIMQTDYENLITSRI